MGKQSAETNGADVMPLGGIGDNRGRGEIKVAVELHVSVDMVFQIRRLYA